jgi:hypothetical protein
MLCTLGRHSIGNLSHAADLLLRTCSVYDDVSHDERRRVGSRPAERTSRIGESGKAGVSRNISRRRRRPGSTQHLAVVDFDTFSSTAVAGTLRRPPPGISSSSGSAFRVAATFILSLIDTSIFIMPSTVAPSPALVLSPVLALFEPGTTEVPDILNDFIAAGGELAAIGALPLTKDNIEETTLQVPTCTFL